MKITFARLLVFLLVLVLPALGRTSETIRHSTGTHPLLFEVIENGVDTKNRVLLEFDALKQGKASWAECRITILWVIDDGKSIEPYLYYVSTDQATIVNLDISSKAISFDMIPFTLAPESPLRFIATQKHRLRPLYEASAVGLWKVWDETKVQKTEWKQVKSIELPLSTIKY